MTIKSRNILLIIILLAFKRTVESVTHWKITEHGRLELMDDSPFTLLRPYDLAAFVRQAERFDRLSQLKSLVNVKELLSKRESIKASGSSSVSVSNYQENFYKTDQDCLRAGQQLNKFAFYETHLNVMSVKEKKLPKEIMKIKQEEIKTFKKPHCDQSTKLPFSMRTFDHLDSIQSKDLITMPAESEMVGNLLVEPEHYFGHLVFKALQQVIYIYINTLYLNLIINFC